MGTELRDRTETTITLNGHKVLAACRRQPCRRPKFDWGEYHITPAAALPVPEIRRGLGAAFGPSYRGGMWFESIAAHHAFRNANRRRGQTESREDAVAALDPDLDDQLFEQRFPLTGRAVEAQLCGDLVERQSQSAQAMRGHDAVQVPVAVWMVAARAP